MDFHESRDRIELKKAEAAYARAVLLQRILSSGIAIVPDDDIMKWNSAQHPRDATGRFISTGHSSGGKGRNSKRTGSRSTAKRKDMHGKPFKKATLKLPKEEYTRVYSEISTNYSMYRGKSIGHHMTIGADGAHTYHFENHGFGDYNIYRKD